MAKQLTQHQFDLQVMKLKKLRQQYDAKELSEQEVIAQLCLWHYSVTRANEVVASWRQQTHAYKEWRERYGHLIEQED